MNENSTSLTFYPSKWKTFLLFFVSLFFTLGGTWMISDREPMGWFVSIFFGIGCIVFIAILLPHSSYLRISEKGFEIRSLFRGGFTNWNEVDQFESGYIGLNKMVVFNYSPGHKKYETGKK
ncbi:hypothetical protein IPG41_03405 [Candidatus Peregrinibacteria bacterium]|nr:MAG: hypothetical protein IPG41_03405 [Candidatus Peregrinibacteria bacterium]